MLVIAIHSVARECIALLHDGLPDEAVPSLLSGDCRVVVFAFCWLLVKPSMQGLWVDSFE